MFQQPFNTIWQTPTDPRNGRLQAMSSPVRFHPPAVSPVTHLPAVFAIGIGRRMSCRAAGLSHRPMPGMFLKVHVFRLPVLLVVLYHKKMTLAGELTAKDAAECAELQVRAGIAFYLQLQRQLQACLEGHCS